MAAITIVNRPPRALTIIHTGPNSFRIGALLPTGIQIAKWRASDGLLMDIQTVGEGSHLSAGEYIVPMDCYDRRFIYTYVTPDPMNVLPSGEVIYAPYPEHSDLVPGVSKITERYLNDPLYESIF